jgi:hypothetical protein
VVIGTLYQPLNLGRSDNWPLDVSHAVPLLDLRDAISFPASFESATTREHARHAVLFPALAMRKDTLAALVDPRERWRKLNEYRPALMGAIPNYAGRDAEMPPLQLSRAGGEQDWGDASAEQRAQIETHLQQLAIDDPSLSAANQIYLAHWLQASAAIAARRGVELYVFPLPRGPYAELLPPETEDTAVRRALASTANAHLLPTPAYRALEAPQFFFDALHVNAAGRERMSTALGEQLGHLLDEKAP